LGGCFSADRKASFLRRSARAGPGRVPDMGHEDEGRYRYQYPGPNCGGPPGKAFGPGPPARRLDVYAFAHDSRLGTVLGLIMAEPRAAIALQPQGGPIEGGEATWLTWPADKY
jgi:hypothetical protein